MKKQRDYYITNSYMKKNLKNCVMFLILFYALFIGIFIYSVSNNFLSLLVLCVCLFFGMSALCFYNIITGKYAFSGKIYVDEKGVSLYFKSKKEFEFLYGDIVACGLQYGTMIKGNIFSRSRYSGKIEYIPTLRIYVSKVPVEKQIQYNPGFPAIALYDVCKELDVDPDKTKRLYKKWLAFEVTFEELEKIKQVLPENLKAIIDSDEKELKKYISGK